MATFFGERSIIEVWRQEYNRERPKKSLGGLTPAQFAKKLAEKPANLTSDSDAECY